MYNISSFKKGGIRMLLNYITVVLVLNITRASVSVTLNDVSELSKYMKLSTAMLTIIYTRGLKARWLKKGYGEETIHINGCSKSSFLQLITFGFALPP